MSNTKFALIHRIDKALKDAELLSEVAAQAFKPVITGSSTKSAAPPPSPSTYLRLIASLEELCERAETEVAAAKRSPQARAETTREQAERIAVLYREWHPEDVANCETLTETRIRQIRVEFGLNPLNGVEEAA